MEGVIGSPDPAPLKFGLPEVKTSLSLGFKETCSVNYYGSPNLTTLEQTESKALDTAIHL